MKNAIFPVAFLLAFTAFAQTGDSLPTMQDVIYGISANAVKFKQMDQLKELLKQGADVNAPIGFNRMLKEGETPESPSRTPTNWPLDVAVRHGHVEMVKLLLANGAKFHGGELANAAFIRNPDEALAMVTALIEAGADVNSPDADYGFTALFWASERGNKNSVKLLLAQPGIKVDAIDIDGETALLAAVGHGHVEIIEMLLKAGANVSIASKLGDTAAARAQKGLEKQQAIVSMLQSRPK